MTLNLDLILPFNVSDLFKPISRNISLNSFMFELKPESCLLSKFNGIFAPLNTLWGVVGSTYFLYSHILILFFMRIEIIQLNNNLYFYMFLETVCIPRKIDNQSQRGLT